MSPPLTPTSGPAIVASRPLTVFNAKPDPREEVKSIVHEERSCTTKELNYFVNSFK